MESNSLCLPVWEMYVTRFVDALTDSLWRGLFILPNSTGPWDRERAAAAGEAADAARGSPGQCRRTGWWRLCAGIVVETSRTEGHCCEPSALGFTVDIQLSLCRYIHDYWVRVHIELHGLKLNIFVFFLCSHLPR